MIEDVVTSGGSVLETCAALREAGLCVSHAVVLLDREQGGRRNVEREGVSLTSVVTMTQLVDCLQQAGKISTDTVTMVKQFISENSSVSVPVTPSVASCRMSFRERAQLTSNPLTKKLFEIMEKKHTNLALSADVSSSAELLEVRHTLSLSIHLVPPIRPLPSSPFYLPSFSLQLANKLGPHICMLKTHVDILKDFNLEFAKTLKKIAEQHNFVIMEDRYEDGGSCICTVTKLPLS